MDSLRMDRQTWMPGGLRLTWGPSCSDGAAAYAVYEGKLGDWTSHTAVACAGLGGDFERTVVPENGDRYFLVVPLTATAEGSFGRDSDGVERPVGAGLGCRLVQEIGTCP